METKIFKDKHIKIFTIKRISSNLDGTYGVIIEDTVPFALTLERPWADNYKDISCIPAGQYFCKRIISPRFGETFEIMNVPNRENILFHYGNNIFNTKGCILIAEEFGYLNGKIAILTSKTHPGKGFNEFMNKLKGIDKFILYIFYV